MVRSPTLDMARSTQDVGPDRATDGSPYLVGLPAQPPIDLPSLVRMMRFTSKMPSDLQLDDPFGQNKHHDFSPFNRRKQGDCIHRIYRGRLKYEVCLSLLKPPCLSVLQMVVGCASRVPNVGYAGSLGFFRRAVIYYFFDCFFLLFFSKLN